MGTSFEFGIGGESGKSSGDALFVTAKGLANNVSQRFRESRSIWVPSPWLLPMA